MNEEIRSSAYKSKWTFLIYMDGDNNLESKFWDDIQRLENVGSSHDARILVLFDRIPGYFTSAENDWTGTRLYYVLKDSNPDKIGSGLIADWGEKNMGDPQTLEDFIRFGFANFSADRYVLALKNHGSGILYGSNQGGMCWDDTSSSDYLTIEEVHDVLASVSTTDKIDLINLDMCLSSAVEILYDLSEFLTSDGVIVANEHVSFGGARYDICLDYINANMASATPFSVAKIAVDEYQRYYVEVYDDGTSSHCIVTRAQIVAIKQSLDAFACKVIELDDNNIITEIKNHLKLVYDIPNATIDDCVDIVNFFQGLTTSSAELNTMAQTITNDVLTKTYYNGTTNLHGLSIVMPRTLGVPFPYYSSCSSFLTETQWDEFLGFRWSGNDDEYEQNDDWSTAREILPNKEYSLVMADLDWFKFFPAGYGPCKIYVSSEIPSSSYNLRVYLDGDWITNIATITSDIYEKEAAFTITSGWKYIKIEPLLSLTVRNTYRLCVAIDDSYDDGTGNDVIPNAATLVSGVKYNTLVGMDTDCYKIDVPVVGYLISITTKVMYSNNPSGAYPGGDVSLFLLRGATSLVSEEHATATEKILYIALDTGFYNILVKPIDKYTVYDLTVTVQPCLDDSYEDNDALLAAKQLPGAGTFNLHGLDTDWFKIDVEAGKVLDIKGRVTKPGVGDIDLALYNSALKSVGNATTSRVNERLFYSAHAAETIYLVVVIRKLALNYTLDIAYLSVGTDEDTDDDTPATARLLELTFVSGPKKISGKCYDPDVLKIQVRRLRLQAPALASSIHLAALNPIRISLVLETSADLDMFVLNDTVPGIPLNFTKTADLNKTLDTDIMADGDYYIYIIPSTSGGDYNVTISMNELSTTPPDITWVYFLIGIAGCIAAVLVMGFILKKKGKTVVKSRS